MQNLQPAEREILSDFQSRLLQSKKTKELLLLSPKAYIDKRIVEIISSQTNKAEDFKISDYTSNNDEKDASFNDFAFLKKTAKNRLIVPSIRAYESNRKSGLGLEETNKENKLLNLNSASLLPEKPLAKERTRKELSSDGRRTKDSRTKDSKEKLCNKK